MSTTVRVRGADALGPLFGSVLALIHGAREPVAALIPLVFTAFGTIPIIFGIHSWRERTELTAFDDGVFTMKQLRWPFASQLRTLRTKDITDIMMETHGTGTSTLVFITVHERIPLFNISATSGEHAATVAELKTYLGLNRDTSSDATAAWKQGC